VCCAQEFCKNRSRSYYNNHKCIVCKGNPHKQGCFTLGEIFCRYDPDKVVCLRCDDIRKKKEERRKLRERQERRRAVRKFEREKQARREEERKEKIKKRTPFSIAAENAKKKAST
jgi:phosphopantetheine adenylyltransferase